MLLLAFFYKLFKATWAMFKDVKLLCYKRRGGVDEHWSKNNKVEEIADFLPISTHLKADDIMVKMRSKEDEFFNCNGVLLRQNIDDRNSKE